MRRASWLRSLPYAAFAVVLAGAVVLLLGGCRCASPEPFRVTYEQIAPRFLAYVEADPLLDEDEREVRRLAVDVWSAAIERMETR